MWFIIYTLLLAAVSAQQFSNNIASTAPRDPCKLNSRMAPHESYCDKYYVCSNGVTDLYDCPNGLVYVGRGRGIISPCDYGHNADCHDRPNRNPPIGTLHCDWLYGIFGHETSCTRYWTCWNGTATELYCVGGLLFNEDTHSCDWPQFVSGCQQHPLCKDAPNGNVPLGKSCERYWKCLGGYPRLQRCPAGLVFDKRALRCVNPPTEDCEIPTTPPPEYLDEEPLQGDKRQQQGRPQGQQQKRRRPQADQEAPAQRPSRPQISGAVPIQRPNFLPEGAIPLGPAQ